MFRKFLFYSVLIAVTAVLAGCKLSGRVTTSTGEPLEGVIITLSGGVDAEITTNINGEYEFKVPNNVADYILTPSLNQYSFNPGSLNVNVSQSTPLEGISGLDFEAVSEAPEWKYVHVFDQGSGLPAVSDAQINDMQGIRTLSIYDFLGETQNGDAIQLNSDGAYLVPPEGLGVMYVSDCPVNSMSELSFRISYSAYQDTTVGIYSRAKECDGAAIGSIYGTAGVAIDEMYGNGFLNVGLSFVGGTAFFNNNGYKYFIGTAEEWNNTDCKITVKQFGRYVQAELFRGNFLECSSKIVLPEDLAVNVNESYIVPFLKNNIAIEKFAFMDQLEAPFNPGNVDEGPGAPYVEPEINWQYSHLFDEGPGVTPDASVPEINTGNMHSLQSFLGSYNSILDSYGVVLQNIASTEIIVVTESPANIHAESTFKFTGNGNFATVIRGIDLNSFLVAGVRLRDQDLWLYIQDQTGTSLYEYNIAEQGTDFNWVDVECRLVVDFFNEKAQVKLYWHEFLVGRIQLSLPDPSNYPGTLSGFYMEENVAVKQYRFAELAESPFEGIGSGSLPIWSHEYSDSGIGDSVLYHDFSTGFQSLLPGLPLDFFPPQQRNAGHLFYEWISPKNIKLPYITDDLENANMPIIGQGTGVLGAKSFFCAVMFTEFSDSLIDLEFQFPVDIDPDTSFCIVFRGGYGLYYLHRYKAIVIAFPGSIEPVYGFPEEDSFFDPNTTQKLGVRLSGNSITTYVNNVEVGATSTILDPNVDNPKIHGFAGGQCSGVTFKSFRITPN